MVRYGLHDLNHNLEEYGLRNPITPKIRAKLWNGFKENKMTENKEDKVLPAKKFRAGLVTATVWENTLKVKGKDDKEEEIVVFNTSVERSYTDKEDKWCSSSSLSRDDIPRAILVLQKAYEFIAKLKEE